MIARVIRKLVLALSVTLAIVLLLLWARTRHTDLVVSAAKAGTYRELRVGTGGKVALTLVPGWPDEERMTWGRPAASGASAANQRQMTVTSGFVKASPSSGYAPGVTFRGTTLTLSPAPGTNLP